MEAPEPPAGDRPREFVDGEHTRWRVTERDARGLPGARGARCLVFESAGSMRRVWEYPPDWRDLPAAELTALSWRR